MKLVEVLIPFHLSDTNADHNPGDVITVSEDQLARIKALNINMVSVLGDAPEAEAKPKKRKPKEE